jgi:hypothetical protein
MKDCTSTLAVAPTEGECRVQGVGNKTTAVDNSDCWLLNVDVKIAKKS